MIITSRYWPIFGRFFHHDYWLISIGRPTDCGQVAVDVMLAG
ncbi:MAG: hypothetical protein ACPG8W_08970 [Candidatus Promineifilaceae bacterium]